MAIQERWERTDPPAGFDGDCFSHGNYVAASRWDSQYRLTWQILRRQEDGHLVPLPESRSATQTFALRPPATGDVEQALRWAEHQIILHRARRKASESGIK